MYQKNHDVSHWAVVGEGCVYVSVCVCVNTCEGDKDDQTLATDNMCTTFPISMLLGGPAALSVVIAGNADNGEGDSINNPDASF